LTTKNLEIESKFKEPLTKTNCCTKVQLIIDHLGISRRELARIIGVSEATIRRLAARPEGKGSTVGSYVIYAMKKRDRRKEL
jgi:transposase